MKTFKKATAVLLSVIMALSLGLIAFATDDYHWTPIPTSPDGLSKGEYYLDFSFLREYYIPYEIPPELVDEYIDCFNNGEFYVDYDAVAFKGTVTFSRAIVDSGYDRVVSFAPGDGKGCYYLNHAIREVDVEWIEVSRTTDGLNEGDWYMDFDAFDEAAVVGADLFYAGHPQYEYSLILEEFTRITADAKEVIMSNERLGFYVNPGSKLMEYRIGDGNSSDLLIPLYQAVYVEDGGELPLELYTAICETCIKQYQAPEQPDDPGSDPQQVRNIFDGILDFLRKIIDFFKGLFKFGR